MTASLNAVRHRGPAAAGLILLTCCLALALGAGCGTGDLEKYTTILKEDFDDGEREDAAEELGKLGDRAAVPALCAAVRDPEPDVREAVAEALGRLADPAAGPDLVKLLRDPEKKVRQEAVKALGLIGDHERVVDLLPMLGDRSSDIREETAEALGKIGSALALPALRRVVTEDGDTDVRNKAAFAVRVIEERVQ
jgi:HEAT repeat protein